MSHTRLQRCDADEIGYIGKTLSVSHTRLLKEACGVDERGYIVPAGVLVYEALIRSCTSV